MADVGVEDRSVMAAFMQALGFTAQHDGMGRRLKKPDGADAYPAYTPHSAKIKPPLFFKNFALQAGGKL